MMLKTVYDSVVTIWCRAFVFYFEKHSLPSVPLFIGAHLSTDPFHQGAQLHKKSVSLTPPPELPWLH